MQTNYKNKIGIGLCFVLVFILIGTYLWDFEKSIEAKEREQGLHSLSDLAMQGAVIAENKINASLSVLNTLAWSLGKDADFQSDAQIEYLQEIVNASDNELVTMGIVDAEGNARNTEGREIDMSERNTFREGIQGKTYISGALSLGKEDQESIVIGVPVYDGNQQIRGVLYGILPTRSLNLYEDTLLDSDEQYVHIIDGQGNYIVQSPNRNKLFGGDNIYEGLRSVETSSTVEEIQASFENSQPFLIEARQGEDVRYVYFTPMNISNWCIVTVLSEHFILEQINYSSHIMEMLILKILITLALFGGICYYVILQEKRMIKKLNRELLIKDNIFKVGISGIQGFVFTYDRNTRTMEFLNHNNGKVNISEKIKDFPENVLQYVAEGSKSHEEIQRLLNDVENGVEKTGAEIEIQHEGQRAYYKVQVTNILNHSGEVVSSVGIMEDITEENEKKILLQSRAMTDPLTKAYNRSAFEEKVNQILKKKKSLKKDTVNAVFVIDLDNFKGLNDTLGHVVGDQALVEVVQILKKYVRSYDIVSRIGGDEFSVLLVDIPKAAVIKKADIFRRELQLVYERDGISKGISASMGIALAPEHGNDFARLYEKADIALYNVKRDKKNGYQIYKTE